MDAILRNFTHGTNTRRLRPAILVESGLRSYIEVADSLRHLKSARMNNIFDNLTRLTN